MKILLCWLLLITSAPLVAAVKGGTFTIGLPAYLKNLHYYLGYDEISNLVADLVHETLLETDPQTWKVIPRLAKQFTQSPDHLTFTLELDPLAQFSDGKPVTADDVKFTWDLIHDPKNKTAPFAAHFASFSHCEVLSPSKIRFRAKAPHFRNLEKLADFFVLPKHFYGGKDFNNEFAKKMLGSGPYRLESVVPEETIILKRNPNYWGTTLAQNNGRYNFDKIVLRNNPDHELRFEMLKKGDIDYYYYVVSKLWVQGTGPAFEKNYIKKIKAENKVPYSMPIMGWNLRRPLFQDRRVRLALAHLFDRERLIRDFFYNNYTLAVGPLHAGSPYHSPKNKPVLYDPKTAKRLLKEAGWTQTDSDGVLIKNGQRFEFELLLESPMLVKPLTIYQEDLGKMGIKLALRPVDFATMLRLSDDRAFDAVLTSRSREVHPSDFGEIWGSKLADVKGSPNFIGYRNPKVDALAEKIDVTFDEKKRKKLVQEIDYLIADDHPGAFGWEMNYFRVAYWDRFQFPEKGYFNYSYWRTAFQYWWYDEAKDKKLQAAMKSQKPLVD